MHDPARGGHASGHKKGQGLAPAFRNSADGTVLEPFMALIVAINLFAPLVPLLSLNGKRGDGAGVETLQ